MAALHLLTDGLNTFWLVRGSRKTQPKKVQDTVTFYFRKNAWYSHPECLLLSLISNSDPQEKQFSVGQILKLRAGKEYGDNSVRPRITVTPMLNLSATDLSSWSPKEVQEPSFTCSRSTAEIESYRNSPSIPPKFSCHTQSTGRYLFDQLIGHELIRLYNSSHILPF